jgi:hypothetical protein
MPEGKYGKALIVRLECGDVVLERCSNWCGTTLNMAHAFMHVTGDKEWTVTITAKEMTSEDYDAMRKKFEREGTAEMLALSFAGDLEAAAAEIESGE